MVAVGVTAVAAAGDVLLEDSGTIENYLHFKAIEIPFCPMVFIVSAFVSTVGNRAGRFER
jgi:hypothetical protein